MRKIEWLTAIFSVVALLTFIACAGKEDNHDQESVAEIEDTLQIMCPCCEIESVVITGIDTMKMNDAAYENQNP